MKRKPIQSRLTTLLVAVALVVTGGLALSFASTDAAYAAEDATNYDYKATATDADLAAMPGVYRVDVDMNTEADPKTIGIPSVAKQNLENQATKEMPAIIMGAAVNYEVRTGAIDFTPIGGQELLPPYSYFRWKYMEKEEKDPDGTIRKIKTLTGFDGSYYIVRIDVSNIIADAQAKAAAKGETLDGKYLHVMQENNKALLTATGLADSSYCWADTSQTNNKGGCKAASYPLANNAEAMKDTGGTDNERTYLDVILMSSAKNVAGADAGSQTAPASNIDLAFYVDDTKDYKPWITKLWKDITDPNNLPTAENPLIITEADGTKHEYKDEATYNADLAAKFYDGTKAFNTEGNPIEANSATKYRVMGEDLEIDVAVDVTKDSTDDDVDPNSGRDWMGSNMDFWSMEKAIYHEDYDNHTIIMICEVPVLTALDISGDKKRSVVLDVNSFDIQIANNTEGEQSKAGLTVGANSSLRIKDGSNTAGAELAIGNNAHMVIEKGGVMYIDETCTAEAEFDAASQTTPSTDPATLLSGEITIKDGGLLSNWGVINIEGTEGKPLDPSQQEQIIRDKQSADILVEEGGILDNYGCISLKGTLHVLGMLNNYAKYTDIIHAYDPDKNRIDYHKGIQITWKDDVTQEGVVPGTLYVGIDQEGKIYKDAVVNNDGDIVMCPGNFILYGTFNNKKNEELNPDGGHLYLCTMDEAIIPIVNPTDPTVVEKRVTLDPPKESVFDKANGTFNNDGGVVDSAKVELIHNGVLGALTPYGQESAVLELIDAQAAVTAAETAMNTVLAKDNPTTDEIKKAHDAVVKAQNALATARLKVSNGEKAKEATDLKNEITNLENKVTDLTKELAEVSVVDISNYAASLTKTSYQYTGKAIKPGVKVSGLKSTDYTVVYKNNTAIGKATVTITGKKANNFKGTITKTFKITKRTNTLKVTYKTATVKYKKLKKKAQTLGVTKVIKFSNKGVGKKTYYKVSGNKKITINKKTGKVTIKKKLKKGTYKVKVKVKAAGSKTYAAKTKVVTLRIKVK